jgi:hypothetical protein
MSPRLEHSLKFNADSEIAHITYSKFFECIGGSLDQAIQRNSISLARESYLSRKDSQRENFMLEKMLYIKSLGFCFYFILSQVLVNSDKCICCTMRTPRICSL